MPAAPGDPALCAARQNASCPQGQRLNPRSRHTFNEGDFRGGRPAPSSRRWRARARAVACRGDFMLTPELGGVWTLSRLALLRVLRLWYRAVTIPHVWDLDTPGTGRTVPFGVGGEVLRGARGWDLGVGLGWLAYRLVLSHSTSAVDQLVDLDSQALAVTMSLNPPPTDVHG
jgi:hypothetical protein